MGAERATAVSEFEAVSDFIARRVICAVEPERLRAGRQSKTAKIAKAAIAK
jgi:hypothetical protein